MKWIKRLAARTTNHTQNEIKKIYFRQQIKKENFFSQEPEFNNLHEMVGPGDWVIDIGANIGHYTKRLSDLVGAEGRVIAFEPFPETFSILSGNTEYFKHRNVTLMNIAVSNKNAAVDMSVPVFDTGLKNYYQAKISNNKLYNNTMVFTLKINDLKFPCKIKLIKIDTEGHELCAIMGALELINKDKPYMIVETYSKEVISLLTDIGYNIKKYNKSPNIVFVPPLAGC